MRRVGLAILLVLSAASLAPAEPIRIELGLGGVFPAGQWTRCRVICPDDVSAGTVVLVRVGDEFETEMTVVGGKAEGLLFMPDESSTVAIEIGGRGRVALPAEARKQLRGVKDKLPVVFLGAEDLPDEQAVHDLLAVGDIFPIRMTTDEFLRYAGSGVEWVRVFVFGRLSEDDLGRLRERFSHFSGSVLVAKPSAVAGWLQRLPFDKAGELMVYHRTLAEVLPVPRGSVRPELYRVFGSARWPLSVRRNVTVCFVSSLALFALTMVFRRRKGKVWGGTLASAACGSLLLMFLASIHLSAPPESVSLLEVPEGAEKGVETTLLSQAVLTPDSGGLSLGRLDIPLFELNPVASSPTQWTEHMLFLDRNLRLEEPLPAPSRELFVRFSCSPVPATADDFIETDGEHVWVYKKIPPPPAGPTDSPPYEVSEGSFAAYLAARHNEDSRVDELQRGMLKYWHSNLRRPGLYAIHWTQPAPDAKVFSAGALVVARIRRHLSEQWEHAVLGLFTEPPGRIFPRRNS